MKKAYSAALADHAHYFRSVSRVEEKTILGLITSSDFIEDSSRALWQVNANILQREETREMTKRGLEELRREEWISENEFQILSNSLTESQ